MEEQQLAIAGLEVELLQLVYSDLQLLFTVDDCTIVNKSKSIQIEKGCRNLC